MSRKESVQRQGIPKKDPHLRSLYRSGRTVFSSVKHITCLRIAQRRSHWLSHNRLPELQEYLQANQQSPHKRQLLCIPVVELQIWWLPAAEKLAAGEHSSGHWFLHHLQKKKKRGGKKEKERFEPMI